MQVSSSSLMPNSNKQPWPLLLLPRFTQRVTIIVAAVDVVVVVVVCPRWQSIFVCVCVCVRARLCLRAYICVHKYMWVGCVCLCAYVYAGLITVLVSRHVADKAANLKNLWFGSPVRINVWARAQGSLLLLTTPLPSCSHRIISLKIYSSINLLSLFPISLLVFFFIYVFGVYALSLC